VRFDWQHSMGAASYDEFVEALRKNIYAFCGKVQTKFYSRRRAEQRLEEEAKLAIAYTFGEFNPDKNYIVKKDWPRAFVMLIRTEEGGWQAAIEPWLGHDDITSVDGIEPVLVPVEWGKTPITVMSRIRSALPWGRREAVLDVALDPAKPQQPRAAPPRVTERDLPPNGRPEAPAQKTAPPTLQTPPVQTINRPPQPQRQSPRADLLNRSPAKRPEPGRKPRP
jgi:hypothetical protein